MNLLNAWSDDHLPCFGFEHNNTYYEVMWSSLSLAGRLELVEEGAVTLEVALNKYPQLFRLITAPDPRNVGGLDRDDEDDEGVIVYQVDAGCINVHSKESYLKQHPKINY